jgi:hypothetical protein
MMGEIGRVLVGAAGGLAIYLVFFAVYYRVRRRRLTWQRQKRDAISRVEFIACVQHVRDQPIYLDPCLFIPQGATPQERADDRARILADLHQYAQKLKSHGVTAAVGVPPWMDTTPQWQEET